MPLIHNNQEYYSSGEVATILGYRDTTTIVEHAKKGLFGAIFYKGKHLFPKGIIDQLEVSQTFDFDKSKYYVLQELKRSRTKIKYKIPDLIKMLEPTGDYIEVKKLFLTYQFFSKDKIDEIIRTNELFIDVNEASRILKISGSEVLRWIRSGKFGNDHRMIRRKYYILKDTVISVMEQELQSFDVNHYYDVNEAAELLGVPVRELWNPRERQRFGEVKKSGKLYFLKSTIDKLVSEKPIDFTNYYSGPDVAKLFGVSTATIIVWGKEGKLGDNVLAIKKGSRNYSYYLKTAVDSKLENYSFLNNFYNMPNDTELYDHKYYTSEMAAYLLGTSELILDKWRLEGIFGQDFQIIDENKYIYLKTTIDKITDERLGITNLTLYYTKQETLELLEMVRDKKIKMLEKLKPFGVHLTTEEGDQKTYYLKSEVNRQINNSGGLVSPSFNNELYIRQDELEIYYGISNFVCQQWISEGVFGDFIELDQTKFVRKIDFDFSIPQGYSVLHGYSTMANIYSYCIRKYNAAYEKDKQIRLIKKWIWQKSKMRLETLYSTEDANQVESYFKSGINHKEMAERLNVTTVTACRWASNGIFKSAFFTRLGWVVETREFENFESAYRADNIEKFVENFNALSYTEQLHVRLKHVQIPHSVNKTASFLIQFLLKKQSKTSGSLKNQYQTTRTLASFFKKIIEGLHKELFDFIDEQLLYFVQSLDLGPNDSILLRDFIKYLSKKAVCKYQIGLPLEKIQRSNSNDKDMYTADEYLQYFEFIMDVEFHISSALESREYCSIWVFVGMHLNCAFRGNDIVRLPKVDLNAIGVQSLVYFQSNRLTKGQAAVIIKQLSDYLHVIEFDATKTDSTYVFTIHPEHMYAMATAIVIAELHRAKEDDVLLLKSGLQKKHREITAKEVNKKFIKFYKKKLGIDPERLRPFHSIKMNRSFLTYMYYSLTEGSDHPALAYAYAKRWRGHKGQNTTSRYILITNRDGSLEQACITLFGRGQFGWVYDTFVDLLCLDEPLNSRQRTEIINKLRLNYTLSELESVSGFILNQSNKFESVINRLVLMTKDELCILMRKIFSGESKSRINCGSCWVGKDHCPTPIADCWVCHEYIPEYETLANLETQFLKSIGKVMDNNYETLKIKEIERISKLFIILYEAVKKFGVEFVQSLVNIDLIIDKCSEIQYKKWTEKINGLYIEHESIIKNKQLPFL